MSTVTMTPRQQVLALVEKYDADFEEWGSRTEFRASVWLPSGVKFVATGCHSIGVEFYSDRPEGWKALRDDLLMGVMPCTVEECDTCMEAGT